MNIVMLGHSNAGKTTYMAALYHLMQEEILGYSMDVDIEETCAQNRYGHPRRELRTNNYRKYNPNYTWEDAEQEEEDLTESGKNLTKGIYPPSTAIRQRYFFHLYYDGEDVCNFSWFDYRGGALMERVSQSSDLEEIGDELAQSNALLVFVDGTQLERFNEDDQRYLRRLTYFVKDAFSKINQPHDACYPVSVVITKKDLCHNVEKSEGMKYLKQNLFTDIENSKSIVGLLTYTTINAKKIKNVQWPLLFSLRHNICTLKSETQHAYQYRENKRGLFGSIRESLFHKDQHYYYGTLYELEENEPRLTDILSKNSGADNFIYIGRNR